MDQKFSRSYARLVCKAPLPSVQKEKKCGLVCPHNATSLEVRFFEKLRKWIVGTASNINDVPNADCLFAFDVGPTGEVLFGLLVTKAAACGDQPFRANIVWHVPRTRVDAIGDGKGIKLTIHSSPHVAHAASSFVGSP